MVTDKPGPGQAVVRVAVPLNEPQFLIHGKNGARGKVYAHAKGELHLIDKALLKELKGKVEVVADGDGLSGEGEKPTPKKDE